MLAGVTPLVLATRNKHKIRELEQILSATRNVNGFELVGVESFPEVPEVAETGRTFAENALLKAITVARATGRASVADDSGICVDVLNGMPGVFSARWAGRHGDDDANLRLLLNQIADIGEDFRRAHFVCAAALALPDGTARVVEGRLTGTLLREPRGENGFGYDPIFVPESETRSTAELTPEEKNAISHRTRAFQALAPVIAEMVKPS
jgi:XTP/dITP diphosphohydrolase